jgi:hypothetical protein
MFDIPTPLAKIPDEYKGKIATKRKSLPNGGYNAIKNQTSGCWS